MGDAHYSKSALTGRLGTQAYETLGLPLNIVDLITK